jgi:hypothetical protein
VVVENISTDLTIAEFNGYNLVWTENGGRTVENDIERSDAWILEHASGRPIGYLA